jgi:hypothetical protein
MRTRRSNSRTFPHTEGREEDAAGVGCEAEAATGPPREIAASAGLPALLAVSRTRPQQSAVEMSIEATLRTEPTLGLERRNVIPC